MPPEHLQLLVSSSQILISLRSSERRILKVKQDCLRRRRHSGTRRVRQAAATRCAQTSALFASVSGAATRTFRPQASMPCLPIASIQLPHSAPFAQHLCSARTCPRMQASYWIFSRCWRCLILLPSDRLEAIGTLRRASPTNLLNYSAVHSLPCFNHCIEGLCVSSLRMRRRSPRRRRCSVYDPRQP